MKMAGSLHPPFSLFLPEENEKTGRARSKREKEGTGNDTGARLNDRRSRNDFPRAIKLSGGLFLDEWTSFSFRCRYPGAGGWYPKHSGQRSVAAHLARTEKEGR